MTLFSISVRHLEHQGLIRRRGHLALLTAEHPCGTATMKSLKDADLTNIADSWPIQTRTMRIWNSIRRALCGAAN
jgi:hypothetical protein